MSEPLGSVNALIASASRRGNIPDAQMTYLITDFLEMIGEELNAYALPVLHARRDDYYLEELMFDINTPDTYIGNNSPSSVRNPAWRLPEYAMAGTVRDVQAVSAGGSFYNLGRISLDDVPNSVSQGWYFYGNYLVYQQNTIGSVAPPIAIRCIVHVKPNILVPSGQLLEDNEASVPVTAEQVTQVTSVTSPTVFEVAEASPQFTDLQIDVTQNTPGYEVKARKLLVTGIVGSEITIATAPSIPIAVGDWVTPTGYTPMIPLPLEMHPLLAQRVVVKFLEAQGDEGQLNQARASLDEMVRQIPLLIQPRAEGKPKKLAPRLGLWRRWRW